MIDVTFEELVQAARKLSPEYKSALIQTLQTETINTPIPLTRERAIAELEARRAAGLFDNVESLYGKYARPDLDISDDELNACLHRC